MVLATHVVVAGVLTRVGRMNLWLGLLTGFLSHFLLDSIPHWDYPLRSHTKDQTNPLNSQFKVDRSALFDLGKIILDMVIGLALLRLFLPTSMTPAVLASAVGAILPDALQFVYYRFRPKWLEPLQRFHLWIHARYRINSYFWGVVSQSLLVGAVLWVSFGL